MELLSTKQTMRLKDYAVIGELARRLKDPYQQLLNSRSARDIIKLKTDYTDIFNKAVEVRKILSMTIQGQEGLEKTLLEEQLSLMKKDEKRLLAYSKASAKWSEKWTEVLSQTKDLNLFEAHAIIIKEASNFLPTKVDC